MLTFEKIIAPELCAKKLGNNFKRIKPGEEIRIDDIQVRAVDAKKKTAFCKGSYSIALKGGLPIVTKLLKRRWRGGGNLSDMKQKEEKSIFAEMKRGSFDLKE